MKLHKNIKKGIYIGFCALFVGLMALAMWRLWPYVKSGDIFNHIKNHGIEGAFLFICLFIIQILCAFIPGEPFEIAAGTIYGPWLGLALCLISIFLGTVIIYYGVKLMGVKSIDNNPKFQKFKFLKDPAKAYDLIFILFLIPGTPKDFLTFCGPFLPISPMRFIAASVLGRVPSIITSTLAGNSLMERNYKMMAIYFAISAVMAAIGIYINKKIEKHHAKKAQ